MELRSSRSRSKTPITLEASFSNDLTELSGQVEKTVIRTTRRTTFTKTNENATSSTDEFSSASPVKPVRRSIRTEKSLRNVYKTSDYSSEDGENEVSSTKVLSQNEKNQLIEAAKAAANGNAEISAFNLYKKSGRYWDVYPKTDWTYSHHSRDRVELAPGVVAMPNMSRKTIHSLDESSMYSENVSHKNINTDTSFVTRYTSADTNLNPKQLFSNNNNIDGVSSYKKYSYSIWHRFKRSMVATVLVLITVFRYIYKIQTKWFTHLYNLACLVMLIDTWLLWKTHSTSKSKKLAVLCLLPLLLFGGLHLLLVNDVTFALSCHPNCGRITSAYIQSFVKAAAGHVFNFTSK